MKPTTFLTVYIVMSTFMLIVSFSCWDSRGWAKFVFRVVVGTIAFIGVTLSLQRLGLI